MVFNTMFSTPYLTNMLENSKKIKSILFGDFFHPVKTMNRAANKRNIAFLYSYKN